MIRRALPLLGIVVALGATIGVLVAAGNIEGMALSDNGGFRNIGNRLSDNSALALGAILRAVGLALSLWLVIAVALAIAAAALRLNWLRRIDGLVSPRLVRHAVAIAIPASFVVGASAAGSPVGIVGVDPVAPIQLPSADAPHMRSANNETPTMRASDDPNAAPVMRSSTRNTEADEAVAVAGVEIERQPSMEPSLSGAQTHWVVQPGDHLWHIAEQTLSTALGRAVSDAEIIPYWKQVIEVNRQALPDPANPDLIFPGMRVALPPLP